MNVRVRNFTAELTKFFRDHRIFLAILFAGVLVRTGFIQNQGLSNDELSAWYRLRFDSWSEFWNLGVAQGDMHPGFYQGLMKVWSMIFGCTEWGLRSLSLLFYVANAILIQRICDRHYSRQAGWIVNAIYAVFTFMVIHTTFTRPYNSGVFFILLAWLVVLEQFKEKTFSLTRVLLLAAGFSGAMYSHYFAFLVAAVLGVTGLIFLTGRSRMAVFVAGVLSCLLFLPHLSVTWIQLHKGGLGWLAPPDWTWAPEVVFTLFNRSWVLVLIMLFFIFFPIFRWKTISNKTQIQFPYLVAIISIAAGVILSYTVTPVMRELVMLFVLPFLLIPAASVLSDDLSSVRSKSAMIGAMTLIGLHSIFVDGLYRPVHFGVFRELGEELNSYDTHYGRQNIVCAMNLNDEAYLNYYLKHKRSSLIKEWYSKNVREDLLQKVKNSSSEYFCYVFNSAYDQPVFRELILRYYPLKVSEKVFPGSAIYLFKKETGRKWGRSIKSVSERWKSTTKEFDFNASMKISTLGKLDPFDYCVFVFDLEKEKELNRLFSVVTLTRNGKPVMQNGAPVFYESMEQSILRDSSGYRFTMPFFLPENALPTDEILFYLWNPDKGAYRAIYPSVYKVE
jgi:hypothetical protein